MVLLMVLLMVITMFGSPGTTKPMARWSFGAAFAALRRDGKVVSWGLPHAGGDSSAALPVAVGRVGSWQGAAKCSDSGRYITIYHGNIMEIERIYHIMEIPWRYHGDIMGIQWRYDGDIIVFEC